MTSRSQFHRPPPRTRNIAVYLSAENIVQLYEVADALHARTGAAARHLMLLGLEIERRRLGLATASRDEEDIAIDAMFEEYADSGRTVVPENTPRTPVAIRPPMATPSV